MPKEKIHNELRVGYIGRLEKEKGIEELLEIIKICSENGKYAPISFHIFGKGLYSRAFENLARKYSTRVIYHGYTPIDEVRTSINKLDAILVPSLFLETFGLVACEGLVAGVPVIGPRDGGLKDLIHPDYAIRKSQIVTDTLGIFKKMLLDWRGEIYEKSPYSKEVWIDNLKGILGVSKNILIIHDYTARIGGAEDYIYFLKNQIEKLGGKTFLFGGKNIHTKLQRIILMALSPISFWRYFEIKKIILQEKPDLIWLHTIHRYIGPWGLLALRNTNARIVMTHHDLGLISSEPSKIISEEQIPDTFSIASWVGKSSGLQSKITALYKYLITLIIWKNLKGVHTHIVPSSFMRPYYANIVGKKVTVFPHTPID